jgi:GTP-binding protein
LQWPRVPLRVACATELNAHVFAVAVAVRARRMTVAGDFGSRDRGNLLSYEQGTATPFSIMKTQDRGAFFAKPGDEVYEDHPIPSHPIPHLIPSHPISSHPNSSHPILQVYEDQIVGVHAKTGDLKVNICKAKQLTNMRSSGADEKSTTTAPMQLTLEDAVEYVVAGEFVEVTPDAVRMGKHPKESRFGKK